MSAVGEAWEALRSEGRPEAGWHVRRVYPSAPCEILAGVLQPGAIPGLLLEISTDQVPSGLTLPQSRGFTVDPVTIQAGPLGRVRFALALAEAAYEPVFAVLCEDAAGTAASESSPRNALRSWIGRLHVWQEFMARHGIGALSEEAAVGLYGELWFLREKVAPAIGPGAAVDAWAGPRGEPNDFALSQGFAEVKSTAQQAAATIPISNLDQLDESRGAIVLAHIHLRSDANGESLGQLVSALRVILSRGPADRLRLFNDLLLASGFIDARNEAAERLWSVRRVDLYRITEQFPRVRPQDVRPGVLNCRYTIDASLCAPYAVDERALAALLLSVSRA